MIALMQKLRAASALAKLDHLDAKSHLSPGNRHKRDECISRLIAIGAPGVPRLVRQLARVGDTDPYASVPMILVQIGDPAVPCLGRALHDDNSHLRHNAIAVLGRIATPAAVRELQDESVDLMDKEAVELALHNARHHGQDSRVAQP